MSTSYNNPLFDWTPYRKTIPNQAPAPQQNILPGETPMQPGTTGQPLQGVPATGAATIPMPGTTEWQTQFNTLMGQLGTGAATGTMPGHIPLMPGETPRQPGTPVIPTIPVPGYRVPQTRIQRPLTR